MTERLRGWALARLALLLERAEEQYARRRAYVPEGAQRFGAQLWQRVVDRFPGLADVAEAAAPTTVAPATQRSASDPHLGASAPRQVHDLEALLHALRDPSAEVAAAAATALAAQQEPALRERCGAALLEVLENADGYFHPLPRVAALQGLCDRSSTPALPHELAPLLRSVRDVDAEVSMAAIAAVAARAPAHVSIEHLVPVMLDESGFFLPVVRSAAARALERAGLLETQAPS